MKKQFRKITALVALALLAVPNAFAQTDPDNTLEGTTYPGGSNFGTSGGTIKENPKGADWETLVYGGKEYTYFKGNAKIDGYTTSNQALLGFHWMGHSVDEVLGVADTIYLCNVATGEYLQIGEYWGSSAMVNHVGLPYRIVKGYSQRAWQQQVFPNWAEKEGYFIQAAAVQEGKFVGRMSRNDGQLGHFEHNKFLVLRQADEYDDGFRFDGVNNDFEYGPGQGKGTINKEDYDDSGNERHPGGFLFQFYPVQGAKGQQEYVIYTHRKTDILQNEGGRYDDIKNTGNFQYQQRSEFYDRDSYLLLTNAGQMSADYNSVRFKKFAGDMGSPTDTEHPQLGDEKAYTSGGIISLEDGLAAAAANDSCRWKLVTKQERDRFRLVASDEKPVDVTSRIVNPKFYTAYQYNWAKSECTQEGDQYTHANDKTAYGWQWYDRDTETHTTKHHVHPYDLDYGSRTSKQEHHKVGTGHFWRTGEDGLINGSGVSASEAYMVHGQEANYCGSIFNGTANIQQTITGLREGLYAVYVRGFYAPHDMTRYSVDNWDGGTVGKLDGVSQENYNEIWAKQAYYTAEDGQNYWHRSHDSYLFAWSRPDGVNAEEVRRMLPSIYEGAILRKDLGKISRTDYINSEDFKYTQLGFWATGKNSENNELSDDDKAKVAKTVAMMADAAVFARFNPSLMVSDGNSSWNWTVPKTVTGAARFFNAVDESGSDDNTHKNASNYRIGLPVYVGSDGELTIGVDHTQVSESNPDEWVCFDEFELLYFGKVEPDEFVVDELNGSYEIGPFVKIDGNEGTPEKDENGDEKYSEKVTMANNTQWIDLFDPTDISNAQEQNPDNVKKVKTVVIRRTMPKDGWSSIVLPVTLKLKHVKEAFGDNAVVSQLTGFEGRTIKYTNQVRGKNDEDVVMEAGKPYIVKPSQYPIITKESGLKYERPVFTKAYSTTYTGVAGWYLKTKERNYAVERDLDGPIWVATDVEITSGESFPEVQYQATEPFYQGDGTKWTTIRGFEKPNLQAKHRPELGTFKMVETGVYEYNGTIPAYSYYWANGKMYFTEKAVGPLPRGMYSYIQMVDQESNAVYAKPFIGGDYEFIQVVNEPTGITDINRPEPDGKLEIYDLQGRKVTNPGRGLYIVNGQKVLFE